MSLCVAALLPAIGRGEVSHFENVPYDFEDSVPVDATRDGQYLTRQDSQQTLYVATGSDARVSLLEPELALPDFSDTPTHTSVAPNLAATPVLSDFGTTDSMQQLYGGYDAMVDTYVRQLLGGSGNGISDCGNELPSQITYELSCGVTTKPWCRTGWYGQSQALALHPAATKSVDISRDAAGLPVLSSTDADIDWSPGFEVRLGFRTDDTGVEFGWWSMLAASDSARIISPTSDLVPAINFNGIGIPFGPAELHQIESELEAHSVEIKHLVSKPQSGDLHCGFWWGVRFFRVRDYFRFSSDLSRSAALDDIRYEIEVDNRMIGPNLGGIATWQIAPRLALRCETQAGVYYNYVDQHQIAQNEIGIATFNTGPNAGRPFDLQMNDAHTTVLSELNVGLDYSLTHRVRLTGGYRLVAAAGVARAAAQIPDQLGDFDRIEIDTQDSLILHGFRLGIDVRF